MTNVIVCRVRLVCGGELKLAEFLNVLGFVAWKLVAGMRDPADLVLCCMVVPVSEISICKLLFLCSSSPCNKVTSLRAHSPWPALFLCLQEVEL